MPIRCEQVNFRFIHRDSNPWPLQCQCSALTNWAMKPLRCGQVNLLGSCVPKKRTILCAIEIFRVHFWDNRWDCLATLHKTFQSLVIPFTGTHDPMGNGFESRRRHVGFFRCTWEKIAQIVQQSAIIISSIHLLTTLHKTFHSFGKTASVHHFVCTNLTNSLLSGHSSISTCKTKYFQYNSEVLSKYKMVPYSAAECF